MGFEINTAPAICRGRLNDIGFRFGIEEEFFLVDQATGEVANQTPASLFALANMATEGLIDREFLQSQVEATTPPFENVADARNELCYVRGVLARFASLHGLNLAASGTHPLAHWRNIQQTHRGRYDDVMHELQIVGRRNMFCGMHVHVEVPDPARRVGLMVHLTPYLPLFLALSSSSPFWEGQPTGLKSYRMAGYSELPRSGIPEALANEEEYNSYVRTMVASGAVKDESYVWWMLRPSAKYPTLELRAPDSCTRVKDAIALASLYRVLVRHCYYALPSTANFNVMRSLAVENKWQAQRHGIQAVFATLEGPRSVADMLDDVIDMVSVDAEHLQCLEEIEHCRTIVRNGSSADEQLRVYERSGEGLCAVADWLSETTIA